MSDRGAATHPPSRSRDDPSLGSFAASMAHHIVAEGWLHVRVGEAAVTKKYVIIDGFVLRVFSSEPEGAHMEETMHADEIIDLRMVESIAPGDPYKPPPKGPCVLLAKAEDKKKKPKSITFEAESEHVVGGHDYDSWWLGHVASAIPDHAVGPALRQWRKDDILISLITEHSAQPSAYKHTDKEWRKAVAEEKKKHASTRNSEASLSVGKDKKGPTSPGKNDAIAARLARAQEQREHKEPEAAGPGEADASYVDVSDTATAGQAHMTMRERNEMRKMVGIDGPNVVSAEARGHMNATLSGGKVPAGGAPINFTAPAESSASKKQPKSPKSPVTPGTSKAAAETAAAAVVKALSESKIEEDEEEKEEEAAGGGGGDSEWWFTKSVEGHVDGPFTNKEMRTKYQKGKVHESSLVRFLPCEDTRPTIDSQADADFAALEEMCSINGPPFMDR